MKLPPGALLSGIGQLSMLTLEQGWPDPWRGVHLLRDLFFTHCVFSVVGLLGFFFFVWGMFLFYLNLSNEIFLLCFLLSAME